MKVYKRFPIILHKNAVIVIHVFKRCDHLEDLWMYSPEKGISPVKSAKIAAHQLIKQLEDCWTPRFLMELRKEIDRKLNE